MRIQGLILAVLLAVSAAAADKPAPAFALAQASYSVLALGDCAITIAGQGAGLRDINPAIRSLGGRPAAIFAVYALSDLSVKYFGGLLYKKNKTLAYVVMGAMILTRAYVLYRNLKNLRRKR
jgi:dolichol kinase